MLRHAILAVIMNAQMFWVLQHFMGHYIIIEGEFSAFLAIGAVFGLLNAVLKPLLKFISLPLLILTAGFFSLVIHAIILFLLEYILGAFSIFSVVFTIQGGVISYFIMGFFITLLNEFVHWLIKK